jgi:hypothetical protein
MQAAGAGRPAAQHLRGRPTNSPDVPCIGGRPRGRVYLPSYRRYDLGDVERWLESCKKPGRTIALRGRRAG